MPVLGDFEFVATGGSFSSAVAFKAGFKTGGRYGKGALSYLLAEIHYRKERGRGSGSIELRINGHTWVTLAVPDASLTDSTQIIRFAEHTLFTKKENSFEAIAKNASGWFGNVICHFHQSTD